MDQRMKFVSDYLKNLRTMSALCRTYGISRKTGYKWVNRYEEEGPGGLDARPPIPRTLPHKVSLEIEGLLIAERKRRPTWGPLKIKAALERRHPELVLPAASTIGDLFRRVGLTRPRRRRRRCSPASQPFATCEAPNDVWCADFKGQFRLGNGKYCYPLTISDGYSRYLLACKALEGTKGSPVKKTFEATFRQFGLPRAIRTDNGTPFASVGAGGLSKLSVWLVKLGIQPERIEPARPDQNGRHERMHRTLKAEATIPPRHSTRAQQVALTRFRMTYNHERPHEALGQIPPADVYEHSGRSYPSKIQEPDYPGHADVRKVSPSGHVCWHARKIFVGSALGGEHVALELVDEDLWEMRFGPVMLGHVDESRPRLGLIKLER